MACGAEDSSTVRHEAPSATTLAHATASCPVVAATNEQHVNAGRAYTQSITFLFFTFTTYYAKGTNESLGSTATTQTTLYEISPGVFSTNGNQCPVSGPQQPPCLSKASEVVLLGDSYVNWPTHAFPADLNALAAQTFRLYAVGGFSMGSGGIGLIPPELDQALAADPNIKTVVMTGGGNDILIPDLLQFPQGGNCKNDPNPASIPDCQKIVQKALDAATAMMKRAADAGVKDVVYFFYPHVPEGTLLGGLHPNAMLDYAFPKVKALCDEAYSQTSGRLTCHFVDMNPVFQGHPEWFVFGDIHPNAQGSAAMAQAVWAKMKADCIAQPQSSGCCGGSSSGGDAGTGDRGCGTTTLLPAPSDPAARGPWPVGVRTAKVGRLDVEIVYPAEPGSEQGATEATYDVRDWLPPSERSKVPDANSPAVKPIGGGLYRDLPIDAAHGPYPVVIFIHGTASFRIASGSTMTHWASRGFVVLAADYPGLVLADQLCSTLECGCATSGTQDIPGDVNAQIAALKSATGEIAFLAGHLDTTRLAISGHSQGGCVTSTLSTLADVQVVIPMSASTNVTSPAGTALKSLLYLGGMSDTVIGYNFPLIGNVVCPANPLPATSVTGAYQASPGPPAVTKRLVGITGGGHLVPTDLCQTNALGRNAIQEAQADGVCGVNSAVIIGLPALFDCGTIDMPTGINDVNYASTAALEETLLCKDRAAAFANLRTALPTVGDFQEAKP
jgi:hypothetical protein